MKNTRERARLYFKENNLNYKNIFATDIELLYTILNNNIIKYTEDNSILKTLRLNPKIDSTYKNDKSLKYCSILIDSHYFKKRECITFNENGFIGFAGWADQDNIKPIIKSFYQWCDYLIEERKTTIIISNRLKNKTSKIYTLNDLKNKIK